MQDAMPFRLRGREVLRIEAFTDVVFGFAITLIVVSLEVPTTFEELLHAMRGFPAFAICFAMLMWVWHIHHTFFRRYALSDDTTIFLNTVLLFVVLFYTYPLKFIFSAVTGQTTGRGNPSTLFIIYGLGFAGIFALFLLMYGHAYRLRHELELGEVELHDTRSAMVMFAGSMAVGLLSTAIALMASGQAVNWAGWVYFLLGPVSAFIGYRRGRLRGKLVREIGAREARADVLESA
jgi:uncharacterized membrane protein